MYSRQVDLGIDVLAADIDRVQLVAADTSIDQLFKPGLGIESPLAALLNDGKGHRPATPADDEQLASLAGVAQLGLLGGGGAGALAVLARRDLIAADQ